MKQAFDLAIIGAGFGGSLMAMVALRLGLKVLLLEQGSHPRVVIGESTTPLSNLLLEKLSVTYDLPRIAPLARWDTWQRAYPQLGCGLKRGFTFFLTPEGSDPLLVAASPHDAIADTHWYRADVDHFLVQEAQSLGVAYRDHVQIETLTFTDDGATLLGRAGDEALDVIVNFVIDATGPRGFLHRTLKLDESAFPGLPATESLYSHFTGVGRTPASVETPFLVDDAAVHHVFDGGWIWVLRFNNGITSAGVAATKAAAATLNLSEGEPAWQRLLDRLPALKAQFAQASACQPFRYLPKVSFRSSALVGKRWAMLPSAAGFVDPLFSTGFSLTLLGIERLARVIVSPDMQSELSSYAQKTESDLLAASELIAAMYATMGNRQAFTAASMLYFAAVSFAETAYRLGKPELAPGFLLHGHPDFGPAAKRLLACADDSPEWAERVRQLIEPFNLGEFGNHARGNRFPVHAEDLLDAAYKLGATRDEIAAMLQSSGFYSAA